MLANLILFVALITQVRHLQRRVAGRPADLATRRDVPALRPLPVPQILRQNCVECHSALTRRDDLDRANRDPGYDRAHAGPPGANISRGELDQIAASLLVLRCARCHNEETLGLMVLKTEPERLATIRRMAALPGSGVRPDQAPALARAFAELFSQ
jgi:hypothetical protein